MARLVSKIYGEALFEFAKESNQLEKMCEEAYDIAAVFENSQELKDFMNNPKVSTDEKVKFVRSLFVDNLWLKPVAKILRVFNININKGEDPKILDFIDIVIRKGRQKDIVQILKHFIHLTLQEKNIGEAVVTTANELSNDKKVKLEEKLVATTKYDRFIVDYNIDDTLIAGIKIKVDDKVYDNTLKTKLFDISKSLRGLRYD